MDTAYYITFAWTAARTATVAVIGVLGIYVARAFLKRHLLRIYPDQLRVNVIVRLVSYILLFIVITIALQEFGINMTALIGAAGVVGVAIGFASQTSISNIISGLFLTLEHPFELDDTVIINNIEGKIKNIDLFAVTLHTPDNKLVRIPNEQVLKNTIINLTKQLTRRYEFTLEIQASADPEQAIQIIKQVISENPSGLKDRAPLIFPKRVTGDFTELFVGVWTTQKEWSSLKKNLLIELKAALEQNGIQLARMLLTLPPR